uniref:DNA/RNA non-specific endonuclease/pyrophosphatase/phosphodiesterase domain-containing protein n=1 Tax=Glossina brevipalpis TaxID=37001 RepID=A0A1A9W7F9_9MUSC
MRLLCAALVFAFITIATAECILSVPEDINGLYAPIILVMRFPTKNYRLFEPVGKKTNFPDESKLKLVCTNEDNFLKFNSESQLTLTCTGGEFVDANGNKRELKTITCEKLLTYVIKRTIERCAANYSMYNVGYEIESKFYGPIYRICYGDDKPSGSYTHHIINDKLSRGSKFYTSLITKKFTAEELDDLYYLQSQLKVFKFLNYNGRAIVNNFNYFVEGRLTPDTEMIAFSERLCTYDYANVIPQFRTVHEGNVLLVEKRLRELAIRQNIKLEVYSGYFNTLKMNLDGQEKYIYLDYQAENPEHPVPQYIYKFVFNKFNNSGLVFVILNDPYSTRSVKTIKEFCKNLDRNPISGLFIVCFRIALHSLPQLLTRLQQQQFEFNHDDIFFVYMFIRFDIDEEKAERKARKVDKENEEEEWQEH